MYGWWFSDYRFSISLPMIVVISVRHVIMINRKDESVAIVYDKVMNIWYALYILQCSVEFQGEIDILSLALGL